MSRARRVAVPFDDEGQQVTWAPSRSGKLSGAERQVPVKISPAAGSSRKTKKRKRDEPLIEEEPTSDADKVVVYPNDLTEEQQASLSALNALPDERSGGTTQNDYLREWQGRRDPHLLALLTSHAPPSGTLCSRCKCEGGSYKCRNCLGNRNLCRQCICDEHLLLPYHRIWQWNGLHYRTGALWQTGLKLYLGHGGEECPRSHGAQRTTEHTGQTRHSEDYVYYDQYENQDFVGSSDATPPINVHHDHPSNERGYDDDTFSDNDINEEEDMDIEGNAPVNHPRLIPFPPRSDSLGNKFITIVDVSGIHHLPVVSCSCADSKEEDVMYLELGLFPASYKSIATVFTLACLKDFRISNLECKTTAYQYFQKLRRLTSPAFPKAVSNRYQELRRVSRQYRNLTLRKWHGYAHSPVQSNHGSLALFCAACPQPGINLKDNWMEDDNRSLYIRSIVTDGNFKSDHVRQKNPADDVYLTNGEAFMTAQGPYQEHLEEATKNNKKYEQKPTCHKYHVTQDQNTNHRGCDITGHAMCACARHGCFAPGSGVDFQKGERQMNIDWSLCRKNRIRLTTKIIRLI